MEPVLDAKKKRLFNKIISTLISVIFIFSSFLTPDLAFAKVTNSHSIQDLGAYSPDSAPQFKIANISIHKDNGLIKDLFQGTNGKLIVHIQDAHVNYEGQKSLARILENLIEEHGIELVLVEGGFGDVGLSSLRYFSTQKRREEIADTYLKKGMIAGEEYLDIISDPGTAFDIYGIEDKELYEANLKQFLTVDALRGKMSEYIDSLKAALGALKKKIYTQKLNTFSDKSLAYERGELDTLSYCAYLSSIIDNLDAEGTQIERVLELKAIEDGIDFEAVNAERDEYISRLAGCISQKDLEKLLNRSIELKECKIEPSAYYSYLASLGAKVGISLALYENLSEYIAYIQIYATLECEELSGDIALTESVIKEKLFENKTQREVFGIDENIRLISRFIDLSLSPEDLKNYKLDKKAYKIKNITGRINSIAFKKSLNKAKTQYSAIIDKNYPDMEAFYAIAQKRDEALFSNAMEAMEERGVKKAVLIAGGFHTETLMPLFEEKDFSYIVVCPRASCQTDMSLYRSLLRGGLPDGGQLAKADLDHLRIQALCHRAPAFESVANAIMQRLHEVQELIKPEGYIRAADLLGDIEETLPEGLRQDLTPARPDAGPNTRLELEHDRVIAMRDNQRIWEYRFSERGWRRLTAPVLGRKEGQGVVINGDIVVTLDDIKKVAVGGSLYDVGLTFSGPADIDREEIYKAKSRRNAVEGTGKRGKGNLVLRRKRGEAVIIRIGDDVVRLVVTTQSPRSTRIRLRFEAPSDITIDRQEVADRKAKETMPVSVVDQDRTDYEKGLWVAKRGEGRVVGKGSYNLARGNLANARINMGRLPSKDIQATAQLHQHALRTVLSRYIGQATVKTAVDAVARRRGKINIQFMEDHDVVLDVAPASGDLQDSTARFVRFDTDMARHFGLRVTDTGQVRAKALRYRYKDRTITIHKDRVILGLSVFSALGQHHEFCHITGLDERAAIRETLEFYNVLSDEDKRALHAILKSPFIDSGNIFSMFLEDTFDPAKAGFDFDKDAQRRERWIEQRISWLLSSRERDFAFDLEKTREIIFGPDNKDDQAERLMNEVFTREGYNPETERRNAYRTAKQMLEENRTLSLSRHGRAGYFLTLLAAASQYMLNLQNLYDLAGEVKDALNVSLGRSDSFAEHLFAELDSLRMQVMGDIEDIYVLLQEEDIPKAQVVGATKRLEISIRKFQTASQEAISQFMDEVSVRAPLSPAQSRRLLTLRGKIDSICQAMHTKIPQMYQAIEESPTRDANFSILMQAMLQPYIRLLALISLGMDPFEMDEAHIMRALAEGGENIWGTPDDAWFEVCNIWIEALPLFIHEERLMLEGSGKIVTRLIIEQEVMESVLRGLAVPFRENIMLTIDTEHISLARQYIVNNDDAYRREAGRHQSRNDGATFEEAALAVLKPHLTSGATEAEGLSADIAGLAAVIDLTWANLRHEVASLQEERGITRYEALSQVLEENDSPDNLLKAVLERAKSVTLREAIDETIQAQDRRLSEETCLTHRVAAKRDKIIERGLTDWMRRPVPTWIILTTQAAGMSEYFSGYWVEDEMSLYNLSSGFQYQGRALEDEARELAQDYESKIVRIAERLIVEFRLEHRLAAHMSSSGETDRAREVLKLVRGVKDLATEVSKVAMLLETLPPEEQNYDGELGVVSDYMRRHRRQLLVEATERVIQDNDELRLEIKKHRRRKRDLAKDKIYGAEIDKYVKIIARDKIIAEHPLREMMVWYTTRQADTSLPRFLRIRLAGRMDRGMSTAREEVISHYWVNEQGMLEHVEDWKAFLADSPNGLPLMLLRNQPLYAYTSKGATKGYSHGYGPCRVDLGWLERLSTESWPQWVGPVDRFAKESMTGFYRLYNQDVHAFRDVRVAEHMKPLENSFLEAALCITHIFEAIAQTIGVGNYMQMAGETNAQRTEVFVRMGGGGSSGFCQPKDILYERFGAGVTADLALSFAGIPINRWQTIRDMAVAIEDGLGQYMTPEGLRFVHDTLEAYLAEREEKLGIDKGSFLLDRRTALPALSFFQAAKRLGVHDPNIDPWGFQRSLVANYMSEALLVLESRIRFSNVSMAHLIRWSIEHVRTRTEGRTPSFNEAIIPLPLEYKDLSDCRLGPGPKLLEHFMGTDEHLTIMHGPEGEALKEFLLRGFDRNNQVMCDLIAEHLGKPALSEADKDMFEEVYGPVGNPGDLRMFTPHNMAYSAITNYVAGTKIEEHSKRARRIIKFFAPALDDAQIDANCLTPGFGANLERWTVLRDLPAKELEELKAELGGRIFALLMEVRLNDDEYRNTIASEIWEAARGADVLPLIVHYEDMTGHEDRGRMLGDEPLLRMIHDLPRLRDTMCHQGRDSSLVVLDAPVQGRKLALDEIAVKQWLALGGYYVSPAIGHESIAGAESLEGKTEEELRSTENLEKDMQEERILTTEFLEALRAKDYDKACSAYQKILDIAPQRYSEARKEEKLAANASKWYRGGGFYNYSERHGLYRDGWGKLAQGLPIEALDLGTALISGLMHTVNGLPAHEIEAVYSDFNRGMKWLRSVHRGGEQVPARLVPFARADISNIKSIFIRAKYVAPPREPQEHKGVRSSIKPKEAGAEEASGMALELYREQERARSLHHRERAFGQAKEDKADDARDRFTYFYDEAKKNLGSSDSNITQQVFGRFLGYAESAVVAIIEEVLPDNEECSDMKKRAVAVFNRGGDLDPEAWLDFMGRGDDYGDIGRLAMATDSKKKKLRIAQAAELLDIVLCLTLTLEFHQMPKQEMKQLGEEKISNETLGMVQLFFSLANYDHVFDMPPRWLMPAESGIGFTDYDYIMGSRLGRGKPFTRDECIELAAGTHRWVNGYLDRLFRERTYYSSFSPDEQDLLLGTYSDGRGVVPIGAADPSDSDAEKEWWTYTQKRELSYMKRDGHTIAAVIPDLDAARFLDSDRRSNINIIVGPGRSHLTCYAAERVKYNVEHPDHPVNLFMGRGGAEAVRSIPQAEGRPAKKKVIEFSDGFIYLSEEEFVAVYTQYLRDRQGLSLKDAAQKARKTARASLMRNPDGILVATRFAKPLIDSVFVPFHGAGIYQEGRGEANGLPTMQSWIHNLLMYDKLEHSRIHPTGSGVSVPEEIEYYRKWIYDKRGKPRPQAVVMSEIINGDETTGFSGLAKLPTHWRGGISKASRQSGGRQSKATLLRDTKGDHIGANVEDAARFLLDVAPTDNQTLQRLIVATPRVWASKTYLDQLRDDLIKRGVAMYPDSDLFSYSRIVTVTTGDEEFDVLELVVGSRAAISNVGLGGCLRGLQPEHYRDEETRKALMEARRRAGWRSMELIERRAEELWSQIEAGDESLEPETLLLGRGRLRRKTDLTGWPYSKPRYMMHDFLDTARIVVDGEIIEKPEIIDFEYDKHGNVTKIILLVVEGEKYVRKEVTDKAIIGWMVVLIENNVGFGLWHPHREDQMRTEYAAAKRENRPVNPFNWGGDLRTILYTWVRPGEQYRSVLQPGFPLGSKPRLPSLPKREDRVSDEGDTLSSAFNKAVTKTKKQLAREVIGEDELSTVLKWTTVNAVVTPLGNITQLRRDFEESPRIREALLRNIQGFLSANKALLAEALYGSTDVKLSRSRIIALLNNREYMARVQDQVKDYLFTASSCPELQVTSSSRSSKRLTSMLRSGRVHACIFDDFHGATDEVYRMMVDAYVAQTAQGTMQDAPIMVIGVHKDWIIQDADADNGRIKRAIVYLPETNELKEIDIDAEPILPWRTQVLALEDNEIESHRKLSGLYHSLGVRQVNPDVTDGLASAAAVADDKFATSEKLQGLAPRAIKIAQGSSMDSVIEIAKGFITALNRRGLRYPIYLYAKPVGGSEGYGISLEPVESVRHLGKEHPLVAALFNLAQRDDVILNPEVGNVKTADNRKVSLRINVSRDGSGQYYADSGYFQVGEQGGDLSSAVQGGMLSSVDKVIGTLQFSDTPHAQEATWQPFILSEEEFQQAKEAAIRSLEEINRDLPSDRQLNLAGIDLELEQDESGKKFWVLDINPRAIGLRHCRSLRRLYDASGQTPLRGRPIVAPALWNVPEDSAPEDPAIVAAIEKSVLEKSFDPATKQIKARFSTEGEAVEREAEAIEITGERLNNATIAIDAVKRLLESKKEAAIRILEEQAENKPIDLEAEKARVERLYEFALNVNQLLLDDKEAGNLYGIPRSFVVNFDAYIVGMGLREATLLQEDAFDIDISSPIDCLKLGIALFHEKVEALAQAGDETALGTLKDFVGRVRADLPADRKHEVWHHHQLARRGLQEELFGVSNAHVRPFVKAIVRGAIGKNMIDQAIMHAEEGQVRHTGYYLEEALSRHAIATEPRMTSVIPYLAAAINDLPDGSKAKPIIEEGLRVIIPKVIENSVTQWLGHTDTGETLANYQVSHEQLLSLTDDSEVYKTVKARLAYYIQLSNEEAGQNPYFRIQRQRALWILQDVALMLADRGVDIEENREFAAQCRTRIKHEMVADDRENYRAMMASLPKVPDDLQIAIKKGRVSYAFSPMRLTHSSANASDGSQPCQAMPSMADPIAIKLALGEHDAPVYPVFVSQEQIEENAIELVSYDRLVTDRYSYPDEALWLSPTERLKVRRLKITADNIGEFFCAPIDTETVTKSTAFTDLDNPFAFLIHSLVNEGIVKYEGNEDDYIAHPERVLEDIERFTKGGGLKIVITNTGMSGAGFASGSAVSDALALSGFTMAGLRKHAQMPEPLFYLSLMNEAALGRGTGYQDTFGMGPGYKSLATDPTKGIPPVQVEAVPADPKEIAKHQAVVFAGRQSHAAGSLFGRHDSFLSHHPQRFTVGIMESFAVHYEIISAFREKRWDALGYWMNRYVELREVICPGGATNHIMEHMFRALERAGVSYGGEMVGAMRGGGHCIFSLTDEGMEEVGADGDREFTRFQQELDNLREWQDPLYTALEELNKLGGEDTIDTGIIVEALHELRPLLNPLVTRQIVFTFNGEGQNLEELKEALLEIKHNVHPEDIDEEEFRNPLKNNRFIRVEYDDIGVSGEVLGKREHPSGAPRPLVEILVFKRLREALYSPEITEITDIVAQMPQFAAADFDAVMAAKSSGTIDQTRSEALETTLRDAYREGKIEIELRENGQRVAFVPMEEYRTSTAESDLTDTQSMAPAEDAALDQPWELEMFAQRVLDTMALFVGEVPVHTLIEVRDSITERFGSDVVTEALFAEASATAMQEMMVRGAVTNLVNALPVPVDGENVTYYIPGQLYDVNGSIWEKIESIMNQRIGKSSYSIKRINMPEASMVKSADPGELLAGIERQLRARGREASVLYLPDSVISRLGEKALALNDAATLVSYGQELQGRAIFAEGLIIYGEGLRHIHRDSVSIDVQNYGELLYHLYKNITGTTSTIDGDAFKRALEQMYTDPDAFLRDLVVEFPPITPELQDWIIEYEKDRLGEVMLELAV